MMWEKYEQRLSHRNTTRKESQKNNLKRAVQSQFNNIALEQTVVRDFAGNVRDEKINIFNKRNAKNSNPLPLHQRFYISMTEIKAGEVVEWNDSNWIVLTSVLVADSYWQGYLLKANGLAKWRFPDTDAEGLNFQNVAEEFIASYDTRTAQGLQELNQIVLPRGFKRAYMPSSLAAEKLQRGTTHFVFDNKMYKVEDINTADFEGIIVLTLEEALGSEQDRVPEIIAPEPDPVPEPPTTREIVGPDTIYYGETFEYRVANALAGNTWYVASNERVVNTEQIGRRFYLTLKNMPRIIGQEIEILVVENTGWTQRKTITIRSITGRG